ncbi:hypothetical protein Poli38472_006719 [Pythium oligandrum]|uniref:Guanylate cyclase domain-containing protein n=1 Tax=Pythium oligandrum TaxID=41045 RepID=A0A8K1C532_PYTOL|nr:hypothetical protein Poli38472_006719 [Pythium oligandrum]|eukprot:TMW56709.1 hypothetical protein Poli38472_006719 [Pythium oligandrum]
MTATVPFYGNKVHPSPTFMAESDSSSSTSNATGNRKRADMQIFPLRFRDSSLDEIFCKHFNVYVLKKVRFANQIVIFLNSGLLLGQYTTHPLAAKSSIFASRLALIVSAICFYVISYLAWFPRHLDRIIVVYYVLHGLLLMFPRLFFLVDYWSEEENDELIRRTLFSSQKSVQMMLLIYFLVLFNASGMRFTAATICAICHECFKGFFVVVFCKHCALQQLESTIGFAMMAFCMLSSYYSERYVRTEFVERLSVAEDRKRRDDLLETMLPVHIKDNLKQKRTDELAEYYEEVSILFCYVSNFQALSKHASAIDLVKLINRIVFCFDKATDVRGVYKVEAIAETYMCAAGVPYKDPYHCEKIADMALTMMRIQDTEQWTFNGVEIQLQIGIHSGPVVAGVVGSKTYSYHLFGDTVNTSSRICSSSAPGKIQISERTRQLLARSGCYLVSERGMMNLKGKGMVRLHWLEGKVSTPRLEHTDLFQSFEGAVEDSIRAEVLTYSPHHRSDDYIGYMNAVEISSSTLQFQSKFRRRHTRSRTIVAPKELDLKDIVGTAGEMESVFRMDHDQESIPQLMTATQTLAVVCGMSIVTQLYNQTQVTTQGTLKYIINAAMMMGSLAAVYYIRKHLSSFRRVKERASTIGSVISALLFDVQLLLQDSANEGPTSLTLHYLEINIVSAVAFGLAIRLRYRNAVLVNLLSLVVYVGLNLHRRVETSYEMTENCILFFFVILLVGHFAYKREFGLRNDFLLKCTLRLEKQKCEDLLANMLPSPQYAEALMQQSTVVDELAEVTLLYSDMVGFTTLGATLRPGDICVLLNKIYSAFDKHLDPFGVYKMDTVGDAFIVIGGLPNHKSEKNHAAAIAAFAIEMLHEIDRFCEEAKVSIQMRIGLHTGKVVGGVVGIKKPRYLIWGHHTVIANLMESRGTPGRIQVSEDTYQHLRSCPEFHLEERIGRVQIGENEAMRTYFLTKDHQSVKSKVINRYLQERPMLNSIALAQLRSCLQLPENSPLSKQFEAARPALDHTRSFVDIIGKR